MPKFKVVAEPMAEVTLSWVEIMTLIDALQELEDQGGYLGKQRSNELLDFFGQIIVQMGEVA